MQKTTIMITTEDIKEAIKERDNGFGGKIERI